jgi:hypothetical protein
MSNLTAANAARLNAALDKKYRFDDGVSTLRNRIAAGRYSRAEVGQRPSVQWDRRKFNRMDSRQQAEYQRKLDTMKTIYCLFNADCPHGSWTEVPKMVFDFYQDTVAA